MSYHWNWAIFWAPSPEGNGTYADMLISGLLMTLEVSALAWILALVAGSAVGVLRSLPHPWARRAAGTYIEILRNIPLLVQLFLWFFVLPELVPEAWGDWLKQMPDAPFYNSVLCLGLFMSARVAVQVSTGIAALPRGQKAAGTALGLTLAQTYIYVLLPMAYRVILPPLTSEMINTIKNSSVALTIGLAELTERTRAIQEFSFQVFEAFTVATVIYLLVNLVATVLMRLLERQLRLPGYGAR
jgi:glutamate/aspartate transport system permease protein